MSGPTLADLLAAAAASVEEEERANDAWTPHVVLTCGCHRCLQWRAAAGDDLAYRHLRVMVLCPECRYKRCPHVRDHRNACTASNAPDQPGTAEGEVL